MEYFDETFVPFYRSQIVYIKSTEASGYESEMYETYNDGNKSFGPMVNMEAMVQVTVYSVYNLFYPPERTIHATYCTDNKYNAILSCH